MAKSFFWICSDSKNGRDIRNLLKEGYAFYLRLQRLREAVDAIDRPSFKNASKLLDQYTAFIHEMSRVTNDTYRVMVVTHKSRSKPFQSISPILQKKLLMRLALNCFPDIECWAKIRIKRSAISHFEGAVADFNTLLSDLELRNIDVNKLFGSLLGHPASALFADHESWRKLYDDMRSKAVTHKKRYISLKNGLGGLFHEYLQEMIEADCDMVCQSLDIVVKGEALKALLDDNQWMGTAGSIARVWTPILKRLDRQLRPHFDPQRNWEYAGGNISEKGKTVTPQEVYEIINKILCFLYPAIWPYNLQTTLSIKSRCQR